MLCYIGIAYNLWREVNEKIMADPGFVPGLIGVVIQMTIDQIIGHINIALRCRKVLADLKDKLKKIEPIIKEIQRCWLALNQHKDEALIVNEWLKEMQAILKPASKIVHHCTVPMWGFYSRHQTSTKITNLIADIDQHLALSPLVHMVQTQELTRKIIEGQKQISESIEVLASSSNPASTSQAARSPIGSVRTTSIDEPLIVGQDKVFESMDKWVTNDVEANNIGVLGKGGSGKTLLLKRLFNSKKVSNHFCDGFSLWLTVSQSPSVRSLRNELYKQIALQKNVDLVKNMDEDGVKTWLNETLQQSSRFALFLDDVWEKDAAGLLEGLGILQAVTGHSNSKVIVSSRYRSVLLKMGVAHKYIITMENLFKDESWELFSYHAFPYNNRRIPSNVNEEKAKMVCQKCGGLPLAIKVVGKAMAGCTLPQEWKLAARRLPIDHSLDACLRLSYDALGKEDIYLQLCFLYIAAAFSEDQIIHANQVIPIWAGEGMLTRKTDHQVSHSSFPKGSVYLHLLADRCLIEPTLRSMNGRVVFFKMHDVLRDLGIRIAEAEGTFYCRVGQGLRTLNENECSGHSRILFSRNELRSLPGSLRAPELCSLLMDGNKDLTKIPKKVMGSMFSLKVLDLSGTSVQSLPESVGSLKQLACLLLSRTPIKLLPVSFTNLVNLEILDLSRSSITELPTGLHNLKTLRHLAMDKCVHLHYLPCSFSRLTTLRVLSMYGCATVWEKGEQKGWKKVSTMASINNLASLNNLSRLHLTNNGDVITEGTLGNMIEMHTLMLQLTNMKFLPSDMNKMSRLRRLYLECPDLVKVERNFCDFQSMTTLTLYKCDMLEELPHLHKLQSLKRLEIIECSRLKKVPQEFGEEGAFSLLEMFSLVGLHELEELPMVKGGAMPLLKIFIIVECSALKIFPKSYFNLKTLQVIKVYGCSSMIMENLEEIQESNTMIKVKTMSIEDTRDARKRYSQVGGEIKSWLYGEFWNNEIFIFLRSIYTLE